MERFILSSHVKRSVHLPIYCTIWTNLGNGSFICFNADLGNDDSHDFFAVIFLSDFPSGILSIIFLEETSGADIRNEERVAWDESLNSNKEKSDKLELSQSRNHLLWIFRIFVCLC